MGEAQQRVIVLALALCACVDGGEAPEVAPDAARSMMSDAGAHGGESTRPGEPRLTHEDAGALDMMPDATARKGDAGADLEAGILEEAGADAGADQEEAGADAGCDRNTGQICAPSVRRCGTCDGRSWTEKRSLVVCSGACVLEECPPHVDGWGDFNGECYE